MKLQILGAHQGDAQDIHSMSLLIDDRLLIDAGGVLGALSLEQQLAIEAVLVTHRHFDHIKDLPMLAHNLWQQKSLELYCIEDTRRALREHFFNNVIWPALKELSGGYYPTNFTVVEPGKRFDLLGYSVLPIAMDHAVPTAGYMVERDGKSLFYTADTGGSGNPPWGSIRPDLLLIETTMSSEHDDAAARFKHLTPLSLERELRAFYEAQGYYPKTVCVHMNVTYEPEIREEIAALARKLDADITVGYEGLVVEV